MTKKRAILMLKLRSRMSTLVPRYWRKHAEHRRRSEGAKRAWETRRNQEHFKKVADKYMEQVNAKIS